MVHPTRLQEGMILEDRYQVGRKLGEGGMSHVYLCYDLKLPGKEWAIKETLSWPSRNQEVADEAKILTTLSHPFLPRIVDFISVDPDGYTYMIMDYIQGETLDQRFAQPESITREFILRCADQLLSVLEYLHQHDPPIVFRDMKPSNVMITADQGIRLIDFGIARTFKPELDQDTVKLGTIGFAAPEQYGSGQTDHRSDLYGLGALLMYLSTNKQRSEWELGIEHMIRSDLPQKFTDLLRRLLQHSPGNRYQSATEARRALQSILTEATVLPKGGLTSWNKSTQTIALMGATSGTGTTHTAIMIAHYLARHGYKVALVEMNSTTCAFSRIQQVALTGMADQQRLQEARRFDLEGVDYWRESGRTEVVSLLGGSYQFLVLDMGHYQHNKRLEEFLRADLPIVVGSGAEWRYQDIIKMSAELQHYPQEKWYYCLPLAHEEAVERIYKELRTNRVQALPWHPDPFDEDIDSNELLSNLLQQYLPLRSKRRKFRFRLSSIF